MRGKIHLQLILLRNFRAQFRTQSGLFSGNRPESFKFQCLEKPNNTNLRPAPAPYSTLTAYNISLKLLMDCKIRFSCFHMVFGQIGLQIVILYGSSQISSPPNRFQKFESNDLAKLMGRPVSKITRLYQRFFDGENLYFTEKGLTVSLKIKLVDTGRKQLLERAYVTR